MISTIRHQSIFDPSKYNNIPVTIIGCGAIGSRIFLSLIELGLTNITCADFDTVEAHNIANQAFDTDMIGIPKVQGLAKLVQRKTGFTPGSSFRFCEVALPHADVTPRGIVFLAVDTFAARKEIVEKCLVGNNDVLQVIDTRIASTHGCVLNFDPTNETQCADFLNSLGDDSQAELSPCGTTITVGTTAAIFANLAVWTYMNHLIDPLANSPRIDLFLKPATLATGALS